MCVMCVCVFVCVAALRKQDEVKQKLIFRLLQFFGVKVKKVSHTAVLDFVLIHT